MKAFSFKEFPNLDNTSKTLIRLGYWSFFRLKKPGVSGGQFLIISHKHPEPPIFYELSEDGSVLYMVQGKKYDDYQCEEALTFHDS